MSEHAVKVDSQLAAEVQADISNYDEVVDAARNATAVEKRMTLMEGLRRYPRAAGWSILLSTAM